MPVQESPSAREDGTPHKETHCTTHHPTESSQHYGVHPSAQIKHDEYCPCALCLRAYRMGLTSSGVISNIRGFRYTATADERLVPATATGKLAILPLNLKLFFNFLYSSNDILCCLVPGVLEEEYILVPSLSATLRCSGMAQAVQAGAAHPTKHFRPIPEALLE